MIKSKNSLSIFLLLLLLCSNLLCMEADRDNKLMCDPSQSDKQWKILDLDITPEKTLIPQGKVEDRKVLLNLEEMEPFTWSLFEELIEEQQSKKLSFILAAVETRPQDIRTYNFYSALELNKYLFGENFSKNRYTDGLQYLKDPTNQQEIGCIYYFSIKSLSDRFKYFCSDYDIFSDSENRKNFLQRFFLAMQGNNPTAQFNLGFMYEYGFEVDRDPQAALRLYRLAADQGYENAKIYLNLMHEDAVKD